MTIKGDEAPEAPQGEQGNPGPAISDLADCPASLQAEPMEPLSRRSVRRRVVALLLVLAAGGAGVAHMALSEPLPAGGSTTAAGCTAPVKVAEQVIIYADKQPAYVDIKTAVTVKAGSSVARDLLALSSSSPASDFSAAFHCYFADSINPPVFVSSGQGLATFTDEKSSQNIVGELLSPGNGWTGSLRGRTIDLEFSSAAVCGTPRDPYLPDWDGAPLALTINSSVPPSGLSPLPDGHSGSSYTWNFPRLNCKAPPALTASVRVSLPTYLATEVDNSAAFGGLGALLAGWSSQIIILLFAAYFWLRYRRVYAGASVGFFLIAATTLGFAAVAASSLRNGPLSAAAVLVGIYGVVFSLSVNRSLRDRLLIAATAISLTAVLLWVSYSNKLGIDGFATPVLGVALLAEGAAAVLAVAAGFCAFGRLRRVVFGGLLRSTEGRLATCLDLAVFWGGTVILAAVAYSAGNIQVPVSLTTFVFSEITTLQYCIPAFSLTLIAAALIIPFLPGDPAAGRWRLWYGLLGFAVLAQFPDPSIGYAVIPVAEVVFALLLAWIVAAKAPAPDRSSAQSKLSTCTPRAEPMDNFRLAAKISGCLAVIPVAYFAVTAISSIPQDSVSAIFVTGGILTQLAGWLAAGVIFSIINTRLPGRYGPVRAINVSALWFAVGFAFSRVQGWLNPGLGGRSWTFFGLQLLLFLVAFSVIWDARILDARLSWASIDRLRNAYNLQQAKSLALYGIPLLLALIALGQQLASGSGVEFVKSALSVVPAVFGG